MKFPATVVLLALLVLTGCSSLHNPFTHRQNLVGRWENRLGSVWDIRADGTFEMSFKGRFATRGSYSIHKNQLTLLYTGGKIPWDGRDPATYRIKMDKNVVRFVVMHDICATRIANLSVKWKRNLSVSCSGGL